MRFSFLPLLPAALIALASLPAAHGQLLYDNGPPGRTIGAEMTQFVEADDFELTQPSRLDRAQFWSAETSGFTGSFTWQVFANSDDDTPGALVASGTSANLSRSATGDTMAGTYPEYVNAFDFGPIVLAPGIYWLSLHNGPMTNTLQPFSRVFWQYTTGGGERPSHGAMGPLYGAWFSNVWLDYPTDLAFGLHGIPLPRITELSFSGATARISFTSSAGEQYRVEYSSSLTAPAWVALPGAEVVAGTGGIVQINDPQPNARTLPQRFYRVLLL